MFSLTFHNSSSESISSHKATDEKAVVAAGTKDEVDGVELEEPVSQGNSLSHSVRYFLSLSNALFHLGTLGIVMGL